MTITSTMRTGIQRAHSVVSVVACLASGAALAQTTEPLEHCLGGRERPIFSGHHLPLTGVPWARPMRWVNAFEKLEFDSPVQITHPPDGSDRLFVVEQIGTVEIFANDPETGSKTLLLDLSDVVVVDAEAGLVGLAFDPNFASNHRFYVNYVAEHPICDSPGLCTRIERFEVDESSEPLGSEDGVLLLEFRQETDVHNGGTLAFGPDGLLYITSGDGGWGAGEFGNAQNLATLRGGILRIDPSSPSDGREYSIPPANPLAGNTDGFSEELWAWGLRNPWRLSFDRLTGDLWIGDVGQSSWEEVDFVAADELETGGFNFGWPLCEANQDFDDNDCSSIDSTPPLFAYPREMGVAVIGGIVYRGRDIPGKVGAYIFSDYRNGTFSWENDSIVPMTGSLFGISSIAEDSKGEILATNVSTGEVLRLDLNPEGNQNVPKRLSETGLFSDVQDLLPAPGLIEYAVRAPLWSDNAIKRRFIALPGHEQIGFDATGPWEFPVGTVFVKHFELAIAGGNATRLETRVLLRQTEGWVAWTYRWNDEQDEAFLLVKSESEDLLVDLPGGGTMIQTWTHPGPLDCMGCHTVAEARVLGVRTRQLNREIACESTSENQVEAWNEIGLFTWDPGKASDLPAYPAPHDQNQPVGPRARAYLASNCANCHQAGGPAPGGMDMRFDTPVRDMNLIEVRSSEGDLGLLDPRRVAVGDKERSALWHRQQSLDPKVRMAFGTRLPDPLAVELFGSWIDEDLAVDGDSDGVENDRDNCSEVANDRQLDTDGDAYGNPCDCDFDNDFVCNDGDRTIFLADRSSGVDGGRGTDMNGDGAVDDADGALLDATLKYGVPGPSFVPEPSLGSNITAALLTVAALSRCRRRTPRSGAYSPAAISKS